MTTEQLTGPGEPLREIPGIMNEIEATLSHLKQDLHFLLDKLGPVLGPMSTEDTDEKVTPLLCPLSCRLDGFLRDIRNASYFVQSIGSAIQL